MYSRLHALRNEALVWPLARMDPPMTSEGGRVGEALAASRFRADVGTFSGARGAQGEVMKEAQRMGDETSGDDDGQGDIRKERKGEAGAGLAGFESLPPPENV
jgi:hypothetical protein